MQKRANDNRVRLPDLRKNPYRGVVRELAEEMQLDKSGVSRLIQRRSYRVMPRLWAKISERSVYARD